MATAMESQINGQSRAMDFKHRVLAMNKASEGKSSNSVMAVSGQRPTASARTRSNAAESPESPNGLIPPHEPL